MNQGILAPSSYSSHQAVGKIQTRCDENSCRSCTRGIWCISPNKQAHECLGALAHLRSHYTLLLHVWKQPLHTMTYFKPNPYFLNYVLPQKQAQYISVGRIQPLVCKVLLQRYYKFCRIYHANLVVVRINNLYFWGTTSLALLPQSQSPQQSQPGRECDSGLQLKGCHLQTLKTGCGRGFITGHQLPLELLPPPQ